MRFPSDDMIVFSFPAMAAGPRRDADHDKSPIQAPGTSAHSDKSQPERQFKHDLSPFVGDSPFAPCGDFDQPEMPQMKSSRRPERAVANHQGAGPGMRCIIGAKAAHGMVTTISQVE